MDNIKMDLVVIDWGVITITILDIIHRPVFYLKYNFSETEFCLRLQVEPTHLGLMDGVVWIGLIWLWIRTSGWFFYML
jgi:hypothetical protein